MGLYANLSVEDKALLDEAVTQLRAFSGQINKLLRTGQALSDLVAAGAGTIVTSLDPLEVIPNTSGLSGAQPLTKEEVIEIYTDINNALTAYSSNAKRQLQTKAAGVNAVG